MIADGEHFLAENYEMRSWFQLYLCASRR